MELKDLANEVELSEVRGGRNSITQNSYNDAATGIVAVQGSKFNLSPVSVKSSVLQQNDTVQMAAIDDLDSESFVFKMDQSQLSLGRWW